MMYSDFWDHVNSLQQVAWPAYMIVDYIYTGLGPCLKVAINYRGGLLIEITIYVIFS